MIEKTFNNARIIHKGDTEANWKKATGFIPKAKEIIIYLPDENYNYCRMKIGDGVNGINDLPFFGGNIEGLATEEWVTEQAELLAEELQGYVDNSIAAIPPTPQSDWDQNDETAKDYIKNRPFYTATEWKEIVNDSYTTENINGFYAVQREFSEVLSEIPSTINLTLDGVEYGILTIKYNSLIDGYYIGNLSIMNNIDSSFSFENTGESFLILLFSEGFGLMTDPTQSTTHSLIMSVGEQNVVKLDNKYLSIDQVYDANSENAQSGIAIGNIITPLQTQLDILDLLQEKSYREPMELLVQVISKSNAANFNFKSDNVIVDWGDGTVEEISQEHTSHNYSSEGFYLMRVYYESANSIDSIPRPNDKMNNVNIIKVKLPSGRESIGASTFAKNTTLTSVEIPDSVTSIGGSAFWNCDGLTSVEIPDSVTSIGDWAFYDCDSLTSVEIPDSVTTIGERAFSDCSSLTSIVIGNSVTSIGNYVFDSCKSLKTITFKSLTPVTYNSTWFNACVLLVKIFIPHDSVEVYKTAWPDVADKIDAIAYMSDIEVLEDKVAALDEKTKDCPRTEKDWVEIVNGDYTTEEYSPILYQVICPYSSGTKISEKPSTVKISLDGVEYNNLIPIDNQHYGSGWIVGNASILNPIFGTSYEETEEPFVVQINESSCILNVGASQATTHNFALSILGDKIIKLDEKYLPDAAVLKDELPVVDQVYNAESANAQSGVAVAEAINTLETEIKTDLEYNQDDNALIFTVNITEDKKSISISYIDKSSVTKVSWGDGNDVTSFDDTFVGILYHTYETPGRYTIKIYNSLGRLGSVRESCLEKISFPISCTEIIPHMFANCSGLTSIEIPDNIITIGDSAFRACSSLTSIEIPDSVTSIGNYAFEGCNSLTNIIFGKNVITLGLSSLSNCNKLTDITFKNPIPISYITPLVVASPFLTHIYVPYGTSQIYKEEWAKQSDCTQELLDKIMESDREATMSDIETLETTLQNNIDTVESIAKGAQQAISYDSYETMITAFNSLSADTYNIGQNVMVITLNVPDLWISGVAENSIEYTYISDEEFLNLLTTNGSVQVGYYIFSMLEGKTDLTGYYKKTEIDELIATLQAQIDALKTTTETLSTSVGEEADAADITSVFEEEEA